ncbi:MAG: tRNA (adenosine(37)-N6)-dimethylallyltransferase MiaA [Lachnospiraceae bacterium]|nr:tRNA (adenosine(37)-N6)-dimethylallyltransferase MiaA [Lachnospiraceae bacterium]
MSEIAYTTNEIQKTPMIILTGPTAVGKTSLSIRLAKELGGEIISADSMQVYRHMDIGSAKIRPEEMEGVPHHLIDILEPTESFDVTVFQEKARQALEGIYQRGHLPIVVGGTGFYIQALLYDIDFNDQAQDEKLRADLEAEMLEKGPEVMHERLAEIDPESAEAIPAGNRKRVIRALEFYQLTGKKISDHNREQRSKESPYNYAYFVLTDEREKLYARIDERVDQMIKEGLAEEVKKLLEMGVQKTDTSMQGLGYREMLGYYDGEYSMDHAVYLIKRNTRHFAKRQLTWFRRERDVIWLPKQDFSYDEDRIMSMIHRELSKLGISAMND